MKYTDLFINYFNERYNPPKDIEEIEILVQNSIYYCIIVYSETNADETYYGIMILSLKNDIIKQLNLIESNQRFNSKKGLKNDVSNIKSDILSNINTNV